MSSYKRRPAAERDRRVASVWKWFLVLVLAIAWPPGGDAQEAESGQVPQRNSTRKIRPKPGPVASRVGTAVRWLPTLDQAIERASATRKPVFWYLSTVPGTFMDRQVEIDRYMLGGPFSFPPLVQLLNEQFVPCRARPDDALAEKYDLKPFEFVEPGFLVLSPEGDVALRLDRLTTLHLPWIYRVINETLPSNLRRPLELSTDARPYYEALRDGRVTPEEVDSLDALQPDSVESMLWAGRIAFRRHRNEEARRWFERAAELDSNHPLAPKAALEAQGLGPFVRGFEVFRDVPTAAYEAGRKSQGSAAPPGVYSEAALWRHSIDYLLGMQNRRGGFVDSDYDFGGTDSLPNVYVAVTSLVGMALLEAQTHFPDYRAAEVKTAIERSFDYAMNDDHLNRVDRDEILWAVAYRLQFASKMVRRRVPLEFLQRLVRDVQTLQTERGTWFHEYANPFVTATALHALHAAREAGAEVDSEIVQRGLDALAAERGDQGVWPYASRRRVGRAPRPTPLPAAAGRMPLCESALAMWQRSDEERLAQAIATSFEYQDVLDAALKYDDHTSRYAYGGFFFWYDMQGRTAAIARLKNPTLRQEMLGHQRALILGLPEVDGCFVDSHELGRCYGTAMALLCLAECRSDGLHEGADE